jgi:hypothetical protein
MDIHADDAGKDAAVVGIATCGEWSLTSSWLQKLGAGYLEASTTQPTTSARMTTTLSTITVEKPADFC